MDANDLKDEEKDEVSGDINSVGREGQGRMQSPGGRMHVVRCGESGGHEEEGSE